MPAKIAALAYILIGIGSAWLVASLLFAKHRPMILRIAAAWSAVSAFLIVSPHAAVFFLATASILYVSSPRDPAQRIFFYFAMLPGVPIFASYEIPFPGINYLIEIDFPIVLNLITLLPLAIAARAKADIDENARAQHRRLVLTVFAFLSLSAALSFRSTSLTNGLRIALEHVLVFGIPVLAISRTATFRDAAENAIRGIMFAGIFVLFIGFMQVLSGWYFYAEMTSSLLSGELAYGMVFDSRGGSQRIPSTMQIIPFGIYMSLCTAIALSYALRKHSKSIAVILCPLFGLGVVLSDSRGALLGLIVITAVMTALSARLRRFRTITIVATPLLAVAAFMLYDVVDRLAEADPYGTFAYRIDLFRNSADSISQHPLFGTPDYLSDPTLQLSRQGQGIIDIVNAYLAIVLRVGFVGLLLFVAPLWMATRRMSRYRSALESSGRTDDEQFARLMLSLIIGYAVAIATVSLVDRLDSYYWMIIILCSAICVTDSPGEAAAAAQSTVRKRPGSGAKYYAG